MEYKILKTNEEIEAIISAFSDLVYRLAITQLKNKDDAEDVYQEVFIRYAKMEKPFENEDHKRAWFIRVTINCCKKLRTSAWFRHKAPELNSEILESIEDTSQSGDFEDVHDAVLNLPAKYRLVIHLFYYEDLSISQISNVLNIKESTITSQLTRARKLLRDRLKGDYDYE